MSSPFICDVCRKAFTFKTSMYRHRRKVHGTESKNEYLCNHCEFKCFNKKELIPHFRKDHSQKKPEDVVRGIRLKCPKCDVRVKSYVLLDNHLSSNHEISFEKEHLQFKNEAKFQKWKVNVERTTQAQYSAIRLRKIHGFCQREYACHRSYTTTLKSDSDRKRTLKSLGTNKIGAVCPARMVARFKTNRVEVDFVGVHVGHSCEVVRMRIPSEDRVAIAGKLKDGFTIQRVLDDVRDSGDAEKFERVHHLKKKDIHNIVRDYNLLYSTRMHEDDNARVELLVSSLSKLEDSPVLHLEVHPELDDDKKNRRNSVETILKLLLQWSNEFSDEEMEYTSKHLNKIVHKLKFDRERRKKEAKENRVNPNVPQYR